MAQPHQYTGEGGSAPGIDSNGVVQEGTGQSYRDSYRAKPFTAASGERVPGVSETIELSNIMEFRQADGKKRATLASSVTIDPPPHVEYGRIQASTNATTGAVATLEIVGAVSTKGSTDQTNVATTTDSANGSGCTIDYEVATNVASVPTVGNAAGSGYAVGDILTATGDTGVTARVTSIS